MNEKQSPFFGGVEYNAFYNLLTELLRFCKQKPEGKFLDQLSLLMVLKILRGRV